jgi:hypothetical protein
VIAKAKFMGHSGWRFCGVTGKAGADLSTLQ